MGRLARHADRVHVGSRRIRRATAVSGEKELLYDEIVRVPFIVCDPDPRADATRGQAEARFVEGIDVVPTILDALGIAGAPHRVEGQVAAAARARRLAARGLARRRVLASSTTASAARAGCSAAACASVARSMVRTTRVEVRALGGISAAALRSRRRSAGADRSRRRSAATTRSARGCASGSSTGSRRASGGRRSTTRDVEARTDAHRAHGIHIGIW